MSSACYLPIYICIYIVRAAVRDEPSENPIYFFISLSIKIRRTEHSAYYTYLVKHNRRSNEHQCAKNINAARSARVQILLFFCFSPRLCVCISV